MCILILSLIGPHKTRSNPNKREAKKVSTEENYTTSIASKVEVKLETTTTFSGGLSSLIESSKSSKTWRRKERRRKK